MKKKMLPVSGTVLSMVALLAFAGCATSGTPSENGQMPSGNTYESGYMDGFKKAREMAYGAGVPQMNIRTVLNGTVVSVNGNSMTIDVSGVILDEDVDGVGVRRTVNVSDQTEVIQLQEVDPTEFARLNNQFIAQLNNTSADDVPPSPPSPYEEISITAQDIKAGDRVTVQGNEGEDLTLLSSISAVRVILSPNAAADPAPTEDVMEDDAMMKEDSMMEEEEGAMMEENEAVE